MQMIATAKFTGLAKPRQSSPVPSDMVAELPPQSRESGSPLLNAPRTRTQARVVVAVPTARAAPSSGGSTSEQKAAGVDTVVETVGKKAVGFSNFKARRLPTDMNWATSQRTTVESIASGYMDKFAAGEFDAVRVAFMVRVERPPNPEIVQVLPLKESVDEESAETRL